MAESEDATVAEFCKLFPEIDEDLILGFLLSTEGAVTQDTVAELLSLGTDIAYTCINLDSHRKNVVECTLSSGPEPVLLFSKKPLSPFAVTSLEEGETSFSTAFLPPSFGFYRITTPCSPVTVKLFVSSPTFQLGLAIDDLFDSLFWGWTGEWTDRFEGLISEVLVRSQEDLKNTLGAMSAMLASLGGSMDHLFKIIVEMVQKAVERHDKTSVGHIHRLMYQFLQMSTTMNICPPFQLALQRFEEEKLKLSDTARLQKNMQLAVDAIENYLPLLTSPVDQNYFNHWSAQRNILKEALSDFDNFKPNVLWRLTPMMLDTMGSMFGGQTETKSYFLKSMQKVPSSIMFGSPNELEDLLDKFSENLLGGTLLMDGMFGYKLGNLETDVDLLQNVLASGCGYVTEQARVHIMFDPRRAALPLTPTCAKDYRKLKSRCKDVKRVLRNFEKPLGEFSLRVNTDFDTFLTGLQKHHPTSWVSDELTAVWREMAATGQLTVFELWYGSAGMIAADVGHATNGCFYVATRWFNHEHKRFQPGFMLALLESQYLRKLGFRLWDLGGVDSSPMMSYKYYVAVEMLRPEFLLNFRESRECVPEEIGQGIVVENVTEQDVLG